MNLPTEAPEILHFLNLVRHATTKLLGIVRWDNTKVNKQGASRLSKLQPKSRNATNLHF